MPTREDTYSKDVLDHLANLLSEEPFEDYYNMAAPEAGSASLAVINANTGQTFIISVVHGKIVRG